jgi:acid phosphatase
MTRQVIVAATLAAVAAACGSPATSPTPGPSTPISATLSPIPVPTTSEPIGSTSVRYRVAAQVTFRAPAGMSGRLTAISVGLINDEGIGSTETTTVDLTLPAGGSVSHPIAYAAELASVRPTQIQVSATGVDRSGKPVSVPPVRAPLAISAPSTNGPFNHVFLVVEENRGFDQVIGNPEMPYLNSLAAQYGLAAEYYAVTHPSIGNYFMLTVGSVVSNADSFSGIVSDDNIVRQLLAAGRTWAAYAEDLPSVGYTGGDVGQYARRHNVFALLSDVVRSPIQTANLVPFTRFAADLAANALPNYVYIAPNLCNNGHDCPANVVDRWLQVNIGPLIASSSFQRDGLLIITYDEATDEDGAHGGGRVAWVAVSGRSKRGYRSSVFYQHQSTLRLTAQALGLTVFPNSAASAPDMSEFFLF